ncbi:hypothetical protein HYPSUDRAFT_43466 [Hypholoma sublateritium FD-334 SS-4]|uniref:Uncharacterized protein n=1 Tax=Hypholoma sublateritium (strain FD-334 SS-4) TaxID=945553 RepID=A0A0D2NU79_HYPSF|nr:hypothetical protein HYPSUDRAFT_43466 [Hypholoma sublateritium FD-334 SS-4]
MGGCEKRCIFAKFSLQIANGEHGPHLGRRTGRLPYGGYGPGNNTSASHPGAGSVAGQVVERPFPLRGRYVSFGTWADTVDSTAVLLKNQLRLRVHVPQESLKKYVGINIETYMRVSRPMVAPQTRPNPNATIPEPK